MGGQPKSGLPYARDLTRFSGQWLELLKFQVHAAAPTFSPSVSRYHEMLDPAATDSARLAACTVMLAAVVRNEQISLLEGEAEYARQRPVDPYSLHWRTTQKGAALTMIARLLSTAISIFEAELNEEV